VTNPRQVAALVEAMADALRDRAGIMRPEVVDAFRSVPRHLFVPGAPFGQVYAYDAVIPTHFDDTGMSISSSSAPNIMATMLEQLDVAPGMRVLEIGAGTGYNAGLLGHLAGPRGEVVSVDLDPSTVSEAQEHLRAANVGNVRVRAADGWLGAPGEGAFDRIIATVGVWEVSPHWFDQLRPGGVLVLPLWLRPGVQISVAFVRDQGGMHSVSLCGCGFMRLRGPHAGPDAHVIVPGWRDRVDFPTPGEWIAGFERATDERVAVLRELLTSQPAVGAAPAPAVGWTARLALSEPDPIELMNRRGPRQHAFGLFAPEHRSLAVFEAGRIVAFGAPECAQRLQARLPVLAPLRIEQLDIHAERHPAAAPGGAWLLERPHFDLLVRDRGAPARS
jgi:protein-L-isoaspartate(D-aspartate) O-methyltransferase